MTPADYRTEARHCYELARLAKSEAERDALEAEGSRLETMAEQMQRTGEPIRIEA